MRKLSLLLILLTAAVIALLALPSALTNRSEEGVQAQLVSAAAAGQDDLEGFARATAPRPLQFPADHGPHPEYQTEWWYYTGNLETETGRHFGYQLTFFRRALRPPEKLPERETAWATQQVYMAHFALTDVTSRRFYDFERLERGAAGLAGAQAAPFEVWLDDWQVRLTAPDVYRMTAQAEGIALDLLLTDAKGPILQGEQGFSPKGTGEGQASYYYSLTRLQTEGAVRIEGQEFAGHGLSWMDHEFSTSFLEENQVGWDWFALQLDDGSELMLFQIRQEGGGADRFSSGTLIAADGSTRSLDREDFDIEVFDTWTSPHTGATYPAGWRLSVPSSDLSLTVEPYLPDQELNVSYSYWEGAVQVRGERSGKTVSGSGYVELTGYAGSMGSDL